MIHDTFAPMFSHLWPNAEVEMLIKDVSYLDSVLEGLERTGDM